jgi:cytoskeletal protein RodZ
MADQEPNAGTPGSPSAATRFARDLRAIREERGVSLEEVQKDTRMPADILGRFESGDLIGDEHYNEVYLRNLLKSYAHSLGISAQEVLSSYDQAKTGAYDGALRRRFLEKGAEPSAKKAAATPNEDVTPAPVDDVEESEGAAESEERTPKKPKRPAAGGEAPAVAALSSPRKEKEERAEQPESSGPARPKRRVASAAAASKPIEKSWGVITAAVIGALVVIALVLWFLFRDPGPEPELAAVPAAADTTAEAVSADTAEAATPEPAPTSPAPQFQTPIRLTVVASENALESFRVRVDDDVRRPYWLNPGVDTTFVGQEEVVVWGELGVDETGGGDYDGATLRLQGLEWTPSDGRILRINQQTGQALLDSLSRVTNAAPTG